MAGLYAMQDQVDSARAALSRAKSYLDALGPTMTAAVTQPAAFVAMLAGDPATAEKHLRFAYESLSLDGGEGQPGHRGRAAGRGHRGAGPVTVRRSWPARRAKPEDRGGRGPGHRDHRPGPVCRMFADRGRHARAIELASAAVALGARTDLSSQHADALLDLAHVLGAAGRLPEAQAAATQARSLYQQKGNLPGARESLGYLTR